MRERLSASRCDLGRRSCLFLIAFTAAGFVALTLIAGLEASPATTRSAAELNSQTVNRALKTDRLVTSEARLKSIKKPRERAVPQSGGVNSRLPDGCEALVSPAADKQLARIPARCIS
jgi:hypothetical protein